MNIKPTGSTPPKIQDVGRSETQKRADAVAAFNKGQPVTQHGQKQAPSSHAPSLNQNAISPEDASAIMPRVPTPNITLQDDLQSTQVSTPPQSPSEQAEPVKSNPDAIKQDTPDKPVSSQLAILARKERAMRIRAQEQAKQFQAKQAELDAKTAELQAKLQEYESGYISKQRLKDDTLAALAEAEIDYNYISEKQLEAGTIHPQVLAHIKRLEAKVEQQDKAIAAERQQREKSQTDQVNQALDQIRKDATHLVNTDPAFELTRNARETEQIVELIKTEFNETGNILSIEEAAAEVEKELEERMYKVIDKTEKLKKRYAPKPASTAQAPTAQKTINQQPQMKTLTNKTGTQRQLSARERALLAFKGEL